MKFTHLPSLLQHLKKEGAGSLLLLLNVKDEGDHKAIGEQLLDCLQQRQGKQRRPTVKTIDGEGLTPQSLLEECQPVDLFETIDVLIVNRSEKLKSNCLKAFQAALSSSTSWLRISIIFNAVGLRSDNLLLNTLQEKGHLLDFSAEKPFEKEKRLTEWLQTCFNSCGKTAAPDVCLSMLKQTGTDCSLLQTEVSKVACFAGERPSITVDDIKAICLKTNAETIWQWGEAFLRRDGASAIRIGNALLADEHGFVPLLRSLRGQFQTAYQVALLSKGSGGVQDIQKAFPYMKGRILEQHLGLAKGYEPHGFKNALLEIDRIDLLFRNGVDDPGLLIDLLAAKLCIQTL